MFDSDNCLLFPPFTLYQSCWYLLLMQMEHPTTAASKSVHETWSSFYGEDTKKNTLYLSPIGSRFLTADLLQGVMEQ